MALTSEDQKTLDGWIAKRQASSNRLKFRRGLVVEEEDLLEETEESSKEVGM